MSGQDDEEFPAEFHRERREHGGAAARLDDDRLARLTEEERVAAGLDPYDPDEVPPAAGVPLPRDARQAGQYQGERAGIRRERDEGEIVTEDERDEFPPTRYDDE